MSGNRENKCENLIHSLICYNEGEIEGRGYDCKYINSSFNCPFLHDDDIHCPIKNAFKNRPDKCKVCKKGEIDYWDLTPAEIIFQCRSCHAFFPISLTKELLTYFLF